MVRKLITGVLIFLHLSCAENPTTEPTTEVIPDTDLVTFVSRSQTNYLNRTATLLRLQVTAPDLPAARGIEVRIVKPSIPSKGTLVLASGGYGTFYYGTGPETNNTLNYALNLGLETMEVRWTDGRGWGAGVAGIGYPKAVRAFGAIVRYLKRNEMTKSDFVIAHGGSGGSFQIAYGLTYYNLEADIDHAILIAGPPTADLPQAIFGDKNLKSYWPEGLGGLSITDYILGWENNGDYCKTRMPNPPGFVLEALNKSSLLSTLTPPDLNYRTRLFFVNTNDVTNSDGQGRLYYDAVQSEKEWHYLPSETAHEVAGIPAGAEKIRAIIASLM